MFGNRKAFWRGYQSPVAAAIGGIGASLIGSSKSSSAAKKAAQTSADAQVEAAKIAANAAAFTPINMSNAFGSVDWLYGGYPTAYSPTPSQQYYPTTSTPSYGSNISNLFGGRIGAALAQANGQPVPQYLPSYSGYNPYEGKVSGVNLTPSPWIQGLSSDAQQAYENYNRLFSQYYQPSLTEGGRQIYNEWQDLIAPTRSTEQTNLFDALQAKGITGISGYDPLTGSAYNPMAASLFSTWAQADKQMGADSINEYLARLAKLQAGTSTARGDWVGINELPLNNVLGLSAQLGGRNANVAGSNALLQGMMGAAQTQAQGTMAGVANKNAFWSGLSNSLSNQNFGTGGWNLNNTMGGYAGSVGSLPQYSTASLFNPTGFGTGIGGSGYGIGSLGADQAAMLQSQW